MKINDDSGKNRADAVMKKRLEKMADNRRTIIYYTFEPQENLANEAAADAKPHEETER